MNLSEMDNASLRAQAEQAPTYLCWVISSFFGIITNLMVLITIAKTKTLHNKSQMIIFSYSLVEMLYMGAYFGTGLARYSAYIFSRPQTSDQLSCALRQMPLLITSVLMRFFSAALALDRFLCVAFPIFYSGLRARSYVLTVNSIIWVYSVLGGCIGFAMLNHSSSLIPICKFRSIFNHDFESYTLTQDQILFGSAGVLYFIASAVLFFRYKKAGLIGETQRSEWRRNVDFDVCIIISVIGLIYLVCSGCGSYLSSLGSTSLQMSIVLTPSFWSFVSSNSHFFVYLKLNPRFREGFKKIFRRKEQSVVHPISGN